MGLRGISQVRTNRSTIFPSLEDNSSPIFHRHQRCAKLTHCPHPNSVTMSISTALASFSSPKTLCSPSSFSLRPTRLILRLTPIKASADNGAGITIPAAVTEDSKPLAVVSNTVEGSDGGNGAATAVAGDVEVVSRYEDPRWVGGTWDLFKFQKNGKTDWDAVIDAEARRRKWLENNPISSSNDDPVVFDTSIVPWWAWIKRFHLPEAERLNGRAAMIGFFMTYFMDSLTGVGLVDQMGNFVCKTMLFVTILGVLLIRKNEDLETLKKLLDETTFYDKQWQATWKDETPGGSKKN